MKKSIISVLIILSLLSFFLIFFFHYSKIKVSVVIPVYNSEKYLKTCVESLLNQTLKNIELIFINDGSTDNSLKILETYAQKHNHIRIYSTENRGVGSARNLGTKKARGKYIGYVDSDDYVNKHYFAELYRIAEKYHTDIAATPNVLLFGDQEGRFITGINISKLVDDSKSIYANQGGCAQWNKIYKKDFLTAHNITSTTYKSKIEDCYFTSLALMNTKKIAIASQAIYYYRIKLAKTPSSHQADLNRIPIYYDILNYIQTSDLSPAEKHSWTLLIKSASDENIASELNMIENKQDKQNFLALYNQYFNHN